MVSKNDTQLERWEEFIFLMRSLDFSIQESWRVIKYIQRIDFLESRRIKCCGDQADGIKGHEKISWEFEWWSCLEGPHGLHLLLHLSRLTLE